MGTSFSPGHCCPRDRLGIFERPFVAVPFVHGACCHAVLRRSALSPFTPASVGTREECGAFPLSLGQNCSLLPDESLLSNLRRCEPRRLSTEKGKISRTLWQGDGKSIRFSREEHRSGPKLWDMKKLWKMGTF